MLAIVEGVRFWAREDAINDDLNLVDPDVLRPMSRMGGITYGRVIEGMELPRPEWKSVSEEDKEKFAKAKQEGQ